MDLNVPRPMLNSPIHEGVADAELLLKRPINFTRPMLNSPTKDDAVGNAFYASVVLRVDAWRDAPIVLDKVLSEMCEPEPRTTTSKSCGRKSAVIAQPAAPFG